VHSFPSLPFAAAHPAAPLPRHVFRDRRRGHMHAMPIRNLPQRHPPTVSGDGCRLSVRQSEASISIAVIANGSGPFSGRPCVSSIATSNAWLSGSGPGGCVDVQAPVDQGSDQERIPWSGPGWRHRPPTLAGQYGGVLPREGELAEHRRGNPPHMRPLHPHLAIHLDLLHGPLKFQGV
jgi:hypothetical protein